MCLTILATLTALYLGWEVSARIGDTLGLAGFAAAALVFVAGVTWQLGV